jgi:hypothetical protein
MHRYSDPRLRAIKRALTTKSNVHKAIEESPNVDNVIFEHNPNDQTRQFGKSYLSQFSLFTFLRLILFKTGFLNCNRRSRSNPMPDWICGDYYASLL